MTTSAEREVPPPPSMSDLLAAGAAATAVSTPPSAHPALTDAESDADSDAERAEAGLERRVG
jgi:hypothetical protein